MYMVVELLSNFSFCLSFLLFRVHRSVPHTHTHTHTERHSHRIQLWREIEFVCFRVVRCAFRFIHLLTFSEIRERWRKAQSISDFYDHEQQIQFILRSCEGKTLLRMSHCHARRYIVKEERNGKTISPRKTTTQQPRIRRRWWCTWE